MTTADGNRRLKAIMFTDIKGYSAMMGQDEAGTVKAVLEHREIVRECLSRHEGEEHETIGDAFVVLFDSVVNAVRCGADIQAHLAERNSKLPPQEQVWLRIGIHLGDIILQGDGIYGDGVNVAARVQDKAEPGGISITEQVFLQIDGKVDMPIEAQGKVELKNIRNPHSLYRLKLDGTKFAPHDPPPHKQPWWLVILLAVLAIGGAGMWYLVGRAAPPPAPTPVVIQTAAPAAPAPTTPAVDEKRAAAGRKINAAMAAQGQARIDLLREALALDPENAAVQNMLAMAMANVAAPSVAPAAASTAAAAPAAPAAAGAPAVKATAPRAKAGGNVEGETRIKRAMVVE
ncbi:MAG: adenylate/guanylate cyclase domain-containing protein [Deltaproteobacteria bacterium]|nr:adenylate/guanylate cyclase domain-containing protein [Deltaproteobacteria bacterium]